MLEILSAHQRMLTLSALRLRRNATNSSLLEVCLALTITSLLMALDISTAVYFLKNLADFAEFVEAFYMFISVAMFLGVYLSFVLNKLTIRELLNEIQIVAEMRKNKYI